MSNGQYDLSGCFIDFTKCPKGTKLIDHFPELSAFSEFRKVSDENMIKLAICTADKESPFTKIKDRVFMVDAVLEFLNYKLPKKDYDLILKYRHEELAACWARYLSICHNITYTEWCMCRQTYDILIFALSDMEAKKDGEDEYDYKKIEQRIKITQSLSEAGKDLRLLEKQLFEEEAQARGINLHESKLISYAEKYAQDASEI